MRPLLPALLLLAACSDAGGAAPSAKASPRPAPRLAPPPAPIVALPPPAPWRAAFSFVDNRLLAHRRRGAALIVNAGSAGIAKYLHLGRPRPGVTPLEREDGRRVARLTGLARLELPLLPAPAGETPLTLSLRAGRAGKLRLWVNPPAKPKAREALVAPVARGWQMLHLVVPAGALRDGENLVVLDVPGGGALEWLDLGSANPAAPAALLAPAEAALALGDGEGLDYFVHIPRLARLEADVIGAGCGVTVTAEAAHGRAVARLAGPGATLDLSLLGGEAARVSFRVSGCPRTLLRARLAVPGVEPSVHGAPPPRNVILWVMDTLRADRMALFTPAARAETPVLARLAEEGTIFTSFYVGGTESQSSHGTIWTGQYAGVHDFLDGHRWLLPEKTQLPEVVRGAGLRTLGYTGNGFIAKGVGFGRGFQRFENLMRSDADVRKHEYVSGGRLLERALAGFARAPTERTFVFLGTIDSHIPYYRHEPWATLYDEPTPYRGVFEDVVTAAAMGVPGNRMISSIVPPPRDRARVYALYDSNISYQDKLVGDLLGRLEAWGVADATMLVVTADHGEELWEHGIAGHGGLTRDTVSHVPLLIHYPPLFPRAVVDEGAEGIDLLPTLADALGVEPPDTSQGESLVPLAQGAGLGYARPAIVSQFEVAHAMRLARWKLAVRWDGRLGLFDLTEDPAEHTDLAAARPIERRMVGDAFSFARAYEKSWRKRRHGTVANHAAAAAAEIGQE